MTAAERPESTRAYALIFNGITAASSASTDPDDWMRLSERERYARAVYDALRAGGAQLRFPDESTARHRKDPT